MQSDERSIDSSELAHHQRSARITSRAKIDAVLRLLNSESVEMVSQELGVTVGRMERWKGRFIEAGSAELAKRQDVPSKKWGKSWVTIQQWLLLLLALIALIAILAVLMQRGTQE